MSDNEIQVPWTDICQFTPRQMDALNALKAGKRFLLYGGALGGGKSFWLRWTLLHRIIFIGTHLGLKRVPVMLACENYPSLKDRQLQKIGTEFPEWLGKMHHEHKAFGRAFVLTDDLGGGAICFRNLDDPSKYQSAEFAAIAVDELTKNDYDVFTHLRSRLRWPGLPDKETWFLAGTNPGGPGHGWVKQLWIDSVFPDEYRHPIDFTKDFAFIPSKADDNPHLDPSYWSTLQTLPPNLRAAFRDGSWDVFIGQAFPQFSRTSHVIKPQPIPEYAPIYMTFDWGYGRPFSIGWWWVDGDGRLYRFSEWYGWSGVPNEGLRLTDPLIAEGIKEREAKLGIAHRKDIVRLAGHDCWAKKPDYKGGGQGPSTEEVFAEYGIYLTPGDSSRELKIRQFRDRLTVPPDGTMPMLVVYDNCKQFIRTIPDLIMDEHNVEDVDTDTEDHIYDEACHVCMARPMSMRIPPSKISPTDRRIEQLYKGDTNSYEDYAGYEQDAEHRRLQSDEDDEGGGYDHDLVSTVY